MGLLMVYLQDHRGRDILRTPIDDFEVESSTGTHLCLVFEPMREPLWLFRRRFGEDKVTRPLLPLFKAYLYILLEGLDFLHSESHMVHTGRWHLVTMVLIIDRCPHSSTSWVILCQPFSTRWRPTLVPLL